MKKWRNPEIKCLSVGRTKACGDVSLLEWVPNETVYYCPKNMSHYYSTSRPDNGHCPVEECKAVIKSQCPQWVS